MPYQDLQKRKEYNKLYRERNLDKIKSQQAQWCEDHKDHIKQWSDNYYNLHKSEIIERNMHYASEHPEIRKKIEHKRCQKRDAPYHEILIKAGRERKCELCGATKNIHTHHKDLDHSNNDLSNLQWLCGSCHNKTHAKLRKEG